MDGALAATLAAEATGHTFTGLAPAGAYSLKITAFDNNDRESLGASVAGMTWVPHPSGVQASVSDGTVTLSWTPPAGVEHVLSYPVYISPLPFSSVSGMTPATSGSPPSQSAQVGGLENGQTYYVAVVSLNKALQADPHVVPIAVVPEDVDPPEPPTNLVITDSQDEAVEVQWDPSEDSAGDLAGYRVYVDGEPVADLDPSQTSYLVADLSPASEVLVEVSAFDEVGNESEPASALAYTLLPNPAVLGVVATHQALVVSWAATSPSSHVSAYRVYALPAPYSSVQGLPPAITTSASATSATVSGLTNGTTYWVAVAAVNKSGGVRPEVSPSVGVPVDDVPPPAPTGFGVVIATASELTAAWNPSADPDGDLAGYRLYIGGAFAAEVDPQTTSYVFGGLSPASAYTLQVSAVDELGNESAPRTTTGYTLTPHPQPVTISQVLHERLELSWAHAQPHAHVKNYRVYVSVTPFSDVSAMLPAKTVPASASSTIVDGLVNGVTYHLAVTTVNKSNAEAKAVQPITGTPLPDVDGPELGNVRFAGAPLPEGGVVTGDGTFRVDAEDPSGVAYVRFLVDGALIGLDSSPAGGWTAPFSPEAAGDGPKQLRVESADTLGNESALERAFTVALAPPAPPSWTSPASGIAVNTPQLLVQGTGKAGSTARVYRDGVALPGTSQVDGGGKFSLLVALSPGPNSLRATLSNSGGESAMSPALDVIYDNTQPPQPKGIAATSAEGGAITLSWFAVADTTLSGLKGYRVYRAAAPFTDPAQASLLNAGAINANTGYGDVPPGEGTWYYAVAAENHAGTQSPLSLVASGLSDATPPTAVAVTFDPQGASDPDTGRVGVGPLGITIEFDEPLLAAPFVSLVVEGGQPVAASLSSKPGTGGLIYTGAAQILPHSPSGLATLVLSARDLVGNRGTEVHGPRTVLLDTDAPRVIALEVDPPAPIRNDSEAPVTLTVQLELDEPLPEGVAPALSYTLSHTQSEPTPLVAIPLEPTRWAAELTLPAPAGLQPEVLSFGYRGLDDLGNESTLIEGPSSFEVYQGDLPPLVAPLSLTATAKPGGVIALGWSSVSGAAEYQLYRRPVGGSFAPLVRVPAPGYDDHTPEDGPYEYVVTSIRVAHALESESGPSPMAQATSDSVPPGPPQGLEATLVQNGIRLEWQPPSPLAEPVTYALYRAGGLEIETLSGLEPLATGITTTVVVDPTPSLSEHAYAVAAVDAVGNVSAPSNSAYLNPGLLPVASLQVLHDRSAGAHPVASWTHPSSALSGYVVSVDGADVTGVSPAPNYVDPSYAEVGRTYGVRAVDAQGFESLERTLRLVPLAVTPGAEARLMRGQITAVPFDVTATEAITGARLLVELAGVVHASAPFDVAAGQTTAVPVVLGGYASLPGTPVAKVTTRREPAEGSRADVVDAVGLPIVPDTYVAQVVDVELERGALGSARLSFTNTGDVPVELLLARSHGGQASNQVRFALLDGDDNVLSTASVQQATGGVIALPGGQVVARVMPGDTFTSAPTTLAVPAAAPDQVRVRLTIDQIHHDLGKPSQVTVAGLSSATLASLVEPPYAATVTSVSPELSYGDQPIAITGLATLQSGAPAASVPVVVGVRVHGFLRTSTVYTDAQGAFAYTFHPSPGEGGVYDVWAKYPDLLTQASQQQFVIQRVNWAPKSIHATLAAGYAQTLGINVAAGAGTPLTALRLEPGALPTGLSVAPSAPMDVPAGATAPLTVEVLATAEAPSSSQVTLTLRSDERVWGTVPLSFVRTTASAALSASPSFVETGAVRGGLQTAEVLITNQGLASATGMTATLLNATKTGPAPSWVSLASAAQIGALGPGQSAPLTVAVAPTEATPFSAHAPHQLWLRVATSTSTLLEVPIFVWVSQSGEGNALFHVIDMYTGSQADDGSLHLGVAGAQVKLDRLLGSPHSVTLSADAAGEALFTGLPAGPYRYRITASGREAAEGNLTITPGVTGAHQVFLASPIITIEWDVTEISIEDKYEIVLQATFETDVPALSGSSIVERLVSA